MGKYVVHLNIGRFRVLRADEVVFEDDNIKFILNGDENKLDECTPFPLDEVIEVALLNDGDLITSSVIL